MAHMWTGCLLTAVGAMRADSRMRSMVSFEMGRGEKERQEYLLCKTLKKSMGLWYLHLSDFQMAIYFAKMN